MIVMIESGLIVVLCLLCFLGGVSFGIGMMQSIHEKKELQRRLKALEHDSITFYKRLGVEK